MILQEIDKESEIKDDMICNQQECYPLVFEPTNEFKTIKPGQKIPVGLHVQMNLATGQKEAKLLEKDQNQNLPANIEDEKVNIHVQQDAGKGSLTMEEQDSLHALYTELKSGNSSNTDQILNHLQDIAHDIDVGTAIAESQMGSLLLEFVQENNFRIVAANVLSSVCSNNPQAQRAIISKKGTSIIWNALLETRDSKLITSLSSLVRSNVPGLLEFLQLNPNKKLQEFLENSEINQKTVDFVADILNPELKSDKITIDWARDWCQVSDKYPSLNTLELENVLENLKACSKKQEL